MYVMHESYMTEWLEVRREGGVCKLSLTGRN